MCDILEIMIIKAFIVGWFVLVVAIAINYFAVKFGLLTWYSFLEEAIKEGFIKSFIQSSLFSKIFLFIIYPLSLGLTAFLILKRLN